MKQNNTLALIFATISGGTTEFFISNTWLTAVFMAAVGAVVGWFITQGLNWCKRQIFKPKTNTDESDRN